MDNPYAGGAPAARPSLQVGDVVRLRGGGPRMTVLRVDTPGHVSEPVFVSWIAEDGREQRTTFPRSALDPERPPSTGRYSDFRSPY